MLDLNDVFLNNLPEEVNRDLLKSFHIGLGNMEVAKAKKSEGEDRLFIEGEASNTDRDEDGEYVLTKGWDLDYFRKSGKVIWGHTPKKGPIDPQNILGIPLIIKPYPNSLYTKAELSKAQSRALTIYNYMKSLPGRHGIQWSVEGAAVLRSENDPSIIEKSWLRNLTLDQNVKNTSTWAEIAKSFNLEWDTENKSLSANSISPLAREDLSPVMTRQVFDGIDSLSDDDKRYFFREHPVTKKLIFKDMKKGLLYFKKHYNLSDADALDALRKIRRLPLCQ